MPLRFIKSYLVGVFAGGFLLTTALPFHARPAQGQPSLLGDVRGIENVLTVTHDLRARESLFRDVFAYSVGKGYESRGGTWEEHSCLAKPDPGRVDRIFPKIAIEGPMMEHGYREEKNMRGSTIAKMFIAAFLLIALDLTVPAAQQSLRLDGLYIGRYPRADTAVAYYFKPSGLVLISPHQMVDPETFSSWKKVRVAMGDDVPGGDESYDLVMGNYGVGNNTIELRTVEIKVNLRLRLLIYQEIWKELWEKEKVEQKSFRFLGNKEQIEIDGAMLVLQKDQTGRKLEGEFANEYRTSRMFHSGRAKFAADGVFSIDEEWMGSVGPGGANHGTGRYEIRGHDIILRYTDGRVEARLFGDLGKISGKESVSLSHYVWIKGLFDNAARPAHAGNR